MAEIRVLDKHTAELIAAGEVVERPSSVAKELLENAIDAGATQVTIAITRGGIQQLQIQDNGCGIEAEYIDKAFIRHATSKIATAEDLDHIHTLGFRGEALASIASVAKVEVLTKTEQDEFACCYRIEGGETLGMEPGARPTGTTITVNELFYNTPARMKFLKKDASEGTFVAETVLHEALSHPEISFRFLKDGKQQFVTPGDGDLRSAAYAALGREFARDLLDVNGTTGLYTVTGLVTPPRACRASRGAQHFYVNGRYVKNRTMMAALENAFKGTLMQGKFPGGILMLTMPAGLVDVNVHPAKTEIRFARESDAFDAVYRAVRAALAKPGSGECRFELGHTAAESQPDEAPPKAAAVMTPQAAGTSMPTADVAAQQKHFSTVSAEEYRAMAKLTAGVPARSLPVMPANGSVPLSSSRPAYGTPAIEQHGDPSTATFAGAMAEGVFHPIADESVLDIRLEEEQTPSDASNLTIQPAERPMDVVKQERPEPEYQGTLSAIPAEKPEQTSFISEPEYEPLRLVGEAFKTYIITERSGELCLIDKHAAHERILFEKLSATYGDVPAQMLLVPVQVNLSAQEKQAVMQSVDLLQSAGIEVEDYGGATVVVRSVPADVPVENVEDMMVELASHLARGARDALREKTEWVLHSISCRAAIKAGDTTTAAEMIELAQNIMNGSIPPFCPHGRPCVLKITRKELEKQFGRLV